VRQNPAGAHRRAYVSVTGGGDLPLREVGAWSSASRFVPFCPKADIGRGVGPPLSLHEIEATLIIVREPTNVP
jgi:hypothetical protein